MPDKPINLTAARIELYLDKLAEIMADPGTDARLGVKLWKRLESERDRLREEEAVLAAAQDRLRQSRDRRAERAA